MPDYRNATCRNLLPTGIRVYARLKIDVVINEADQSLATFDRNHFIIAILSDL